MVLLLVMMMTFMMMVVVIMITRRSNSSTNLLPRYFDYDLAAVGDGAANDDDDDGYGNDGAIPHICHFWYATKCSSPVKCTPKKCVNSQQKLPRNKTA